ncbi:hypothetical protein DPMN_045100 [Dreissena polymorpha]|uniref:Uncharacterized protein n=1 Tax=Dreissena polymorpha TaxID=45954 RepID=A0A9D4D3H6_DREPO|nr:hypothetical protein DPMN_045100 [Dreissena polymorpha]
MSESVLLTHFGKESGGKSPPVCEEGALRDFSMFKNHTSNLTIRGACRQNTVSRRDVGKVPKHDGTFCHLQGAPRKYSRL